MERHEKKYRKKFNDSYHPSSNSEKSTIFANLRKKERPVDWSQNTVSIFFGTIFFSFIQQLESRAAAAAPL